MSIDPNSLAAGVGSAVKNVVFQPIAEVVPRKIVIVGTYDPTILTITDEVPVLVTSAADVGAQFGFGFMLHRLALQAELGAQGIETWIQPQSEEGSAVVAAGELDFTGSTGIVAGILALYIAGIRVPVTIATAATIEDIADAVVLAINADANLPVTAIKVAVTFEVTITSKTLGPWGNDISLAANLLPTDEAVTGIAFDVTAMASGTGLPDIQDALDGLGTGDVANEAFFTDFIHGYGQDTTTLDAISTYVGPGNDFVGLYAKLVHRPFRTLNGDVVPGSGGLSALVALGDGRKSDRANGSIAAPDSPNHPEEIAAQAIGHMARINNNRAEENYVDIVLIGILPGDTIDRWTNEYDDRDIAVKAGISPTKVVSGAVLMQNVVSYYHPDNVPVTSNGYRSMRNISILQNILDSQAATFEAEKWKGISIVADTTKVGNINDRLKARDTDAVLDDLVALAESWEDNAWIFESDFTIDQLKVPGSVVIRVGGDGFEMNTKIILSGEGNILDAVTEFDTSIAVLL